MTKHRNSSRNQKGLFSRIMIYILITFVVPFVVKKIQRKILREQLLRCEVCKRKLEMIKKNEYYCKYCKIIRIDDRK